MLLPVIDTHQGQSVPTQVFIAHLPLCHSAGAASRMVAGARRQRAPWSRDKPRPPRGWRPPLGRDSIAPAARRGPRPAPPCLRDHAALRCRRPLATATSSCAGHAISCDLPRLKCVPGRGSPRIREHHPGRAWVACRIGKRFSTTLLGECADLETQKTGNLSLLKAPGDFLAFPEGMLST